jgi:7-cyano-7-deazaguanine synthase in queuosine biosynthesis
MISAFCATVVAIIIATNKKQREYLHFDFMYNHIDNKIKVSKAITKRLRVSLISLCVKYDFCSEEWPGETFINLMRESC